MAIQTRRGSYNDFDPEKLLPGEWATVQSDDPDSNDGQSIYMCFAPGETKRMATYEDMVQNIDAATDDVKNQFSAGVQAATEAANTAAASATEATSAATEAADRADSISDSIQGAIEGTLINDISTSSLTVYSSQKVEGDFRKKTDILDIQHGGTGQTTAYGARVALDVVGKEDVIDVQHGGTEATTVGEALRNLGLVFKRGDTYKIGQYISAGYVTTSASEFDCCIYLPKLIDTDVTSLTISGETKIRQSGKYIVGGASDNKDLSSLSITAPINSGRCAFQLQIKSGLNSAENNTVAAAFFNNLIVSFD